MANHVMRSTLVLLASQLHIRAEKAVRPKSSGASSLSHDTVTVGAAANLVKPEPFLADGHAVLSAAIVWNTRVPSVRSTEAVPPRCPRPPGCGKGDTRLPHFERHVDWIKARMIDGHRNEASRAVPVARRQNGNRKALDLAGARTMRVSRWWSNLGGAR